MPTGSILDLGGAGEWCKSRTFKRLHTILGLVSPSLEIMTAPFAHRLRRSILITPGDRPDRLRKALTLGADAVVADLEDGVSPSRKDEARRTVNTWLAESSGHNCEVMVRPSSVSSGLLEADLQAVDMTRIDALFVPKVESPEEVTELERCLEKAEAAQNAQHQTPVILSLETPRALFAADKIATATSRAVGLFLGSGDYAALTGISLSRESLLWARSQLVAAAALAEVQAIDAAWFLDVKNAQATREDAAHAKDLGFDGKLVFHPGQIDIANRVFSPTDDEIARARRMIEGFEQAVARGEGTAYVDGEFVSIDIMPPLKRLLAAADAIKHR